MNLPLVARTHDRGDFYKYMSASTAQVVLSNRTLRWSAPTEFNDPFDVPRELALNLEPLDIIAAVTERFIQLIKNPPKNLSNFKPEIQLIIATVKQADSAKLNDNLVASLQQVIKKELLNSETLDNFRNNWRGTVNNMRILCLCESHTKTSMWYHYADKYKGVVIEFLCNDDSDSPWRIARPIEYIDDEPIVSTADGWARLFMMPNEEALSKLLDICLYSKSEDWGYEKEWRVASFKRPEDSGPYSDYTFNEKAIGNLYLGPLIDSQVKERLILASTEYNNMQVFESDIGASRQLKFNTING